MTNIAVVGIGRWGKNLVRCFDIVGNLMCCCHRGSQDNREWLRENYPHVELYTDFQRVLVNPEIDAVAIATPVGTHAELGRAALEAGKDIFVEKPLAASVDEARELVELATSLGRKLLTGYVFLYSDAFTELRTLLDGSPPRYIRANWSKYGTFDSPIKHQLVCHDTAIGHRLFDNPFQRTEVFENVGLRTSTDILGVRFETNRNLAMTARYNRIAGSEEKSVMVIAETGRMYEILNDDLYSIDNGQRSKIALESKTEPLLAECQAFVSWIEGGPTPPSAGRFGLRVSEVLDNLTS